MYGSCCGEARHCIRTANLIYEYSTFLQKEFLFMTWPLCPMYLNRHGRPIHCRTWQNYSERRLCFRIIWIRKKKKVPASVDFFYLFMRHHWSIWNRMEVQSLFEKNRKPACCCFGRNGKSGYCYWSETMGSGLHELKVRERKLLSLIYEASGRRI